MQQANYISNNPPSDAEILQNNLRAAHNAQLEKAQNLIDAANRIPSEIVDDVTAGKAADYIKQVTGVRKNMESLRVDSKEPYLTLGRVVDGFFKTVTDSLDGAASKARRPLDAYMKRKADAERREREEQAREARRIAEEQALTAAAFERARQTEAAADMLTQASVTEQAAVKLEKAAEVRPAELAKSRGDSGALASLRTVWVGEITDLATLDLEVLRHHIPPDALQKAVNSYVRAGGRALKGVNIFEKSETVVR